MWRPLYKQTMKAIIYHYTGQNDPEVADMKICIEPQGHSDQKKFGNLKFPNMIQQKISRKANGQKQKYKNI